MDGIYSIEIPAGTTVLRVHANDGSGLGIHAHVRFEGDSPYTERIIQATQERENRNMATTEIRFDWGEVESTREIQRNEVIAQVRADLRELDEKCSRLARGENPPRHGLNPASENIMTFINEVTHLLGTTL